MGLPQGLGALRAGPALPGRPGSETGVAPVNQEKEHPARLTGNPAFRGTSHGKMSVPLIMEPRRAKIGIPADGSNGTALWQSVKVLYHTGEGSSTLEKDNSPY